MASPESRRTAASVMHRFAAAADAAQIADALVATWQEINAALTPIIGERGVAALYKRSLYLTSAAYPWLSDRHEGPQTSIDLVILKSVLAQQSSANAAAGGGALLQTFYELLTVLVGASLSEQLLHRVWVNSVGGPPSQDTSL